MKIALISCSKSKRDVVCPAADMYMPSPLFSKSYEYAKRIADKVYILSAKHGLLEEDAIISPYDLTLSEMNSEKRNQWARNVLAQLKSECDINTEEFIIFAGSKYYSPLLPYLKNYMIPLKDLPLGFRLSALNQLLQDRTIDNQQFSPNLSSQAHPLSMAEELHRLFNGLTRYNYNEISNVPFDNGIYIVFENGEEYMGWERVVRIGTHTSQNRLRKRLRDHFMSENKDGSIFRKNVGKALLNQRNDSYLPIWTQDTSKEENAVHIDREVQKSIEAEVSTYIRNKMQFAVIEVENKEERLRLEAAIISTLNHTIAFGPGASWLGNYSPEEKIRNSGLWLTQGLDAPPLSDEEFLLVHDLTENGDSSSTSKPQKSIAIRRPFQVCPANNTRDEASNKIGIATIRKFIQDLFDQQRANGLNECILTSGEIHRDMGLKNKMPSVCMAMYQLMGEKDEILHTTPSGKSSTIQIRYYLD